MLTSPTVQISGTINSTALNSTSVLKKGAVVRLVFECSQAPFGGLSLTDIAVSGGTIASLDPLPDVGSFYQAVFTPLENSSEDAKISIAANAFLGNISQLPNIAATLTIKVNTRIPTVKIDSDKFSLKRGESAKLTFTVSEYGGDFRRDYIQDISQYGQLGDPTPSSQTSSSRAYTAVFTPRNDINKKPVTISVLEDSFTSSSMKTGTALASLAIVLDTMPGPNALGGNDWDATGAGYVGYFHARGTMRSTDAQKSWADVDVDAKIEELKVDEISITTALKMTKYYDGDIDGLSSTGTSSVKEGEEKFIFGAAYAGHRGVTVSEVAGLSGTYVKGKRVTSLKGDAYAYQDGAWSINNATVANFESNTTVTNDRNTKAAANNNYTETTSRNWDTTRKSADKIAVFNKADNTLTTLNLVGGATTTATFTGGAQTALAVTSVMTTANVALKAFEFKIMGVNTSFDIGNSFTKATIAASNRVIHLTFLSQIIYCGDNFTLFRKDLKAGESTYDLIVNAVAINQRKTEASQQKVVIDQAKVTNTEMDIATTIFAKHECKTEVKGLDMSVVKVRLQLSDTKTKLDSGNQVINSVDMSIDL